jgi:hypothetical protein
MPARYPESQDGYRFSLRWAYCDRGRSLADGVPRSEVQLLRQLYFNRTGILFLLMALASIGMLAASSKTSGVAGQLWLALGSATLATTGYSFVQVLLTTRQFNDFLADAIKSDIRSAMTAASAESMEQFRALQTQYVPVATYPALDATNPGFNNDLNASIAASDHYIFRGMTARYALARLSQLPRVPREIKIIVADPAKPGAVDFRARRDAGTGDEARMNSSPGCMR